MIATKTVGVNQEGACFVEKIKGGGSVDFASLELVLGPVAQVRVASIGSKKRDLKNWLVSMFV